MTIADNDTSLQPTHYKSPQLQFIWNYHHHRPTIINPAQMESNRACNEQSVSALYSTFTQERKPLKSIVTEFLDSQYRSL